MVVVEDFSRLVVVGAFTSPLISRGVDVGIETDSEVTSDDVDESAGTAAAVAAVDTLNADAGIAAAPAAVATVMGPVVVNIVVDFEAEAVNIVDVAAAASTTAFEMESSLRAFELSTTRFPATNFFTSLDNKIFNVSSSLEKTFDLSSFVDEVSAAICIDALLDAAVTNVADAAVTDAAVTDKTGVTTDDSTAIHDTVVALEIACDTVVKAGADGSIADDAATTDDIPDDAATDDVVTTGITTVLDGNAAAPSATPSEASKAEATSPPVEGVTTGEGVTAGDGLTSCEGVTAGEGDFTFGMRGGTLCEGGTMSSIIA